jgi:hypothetical protein
MILLYILLYISVLSGNKSLIPCISSHIFETYLDTKHNLSILNTKQRPCIYVTNYPIPFYNYLITELLPENTVLIGGGGNMFYNASLLAKYSFPIDLKNKGNFDNIKHVISDYNQRNFNILVFVEEVHVLENKKKLTDIGRIKTGIFSIAKDLKIPVVPIYIGVMKYKMAISVSNIHYIYAKKSQMFVDDVDSITRYVSNFFNKHKAKHRILRSPN